MHAWKLQDAKARFSEFLENALKKGPQVVTRRGVPTAVLLPIEEWRRVQAASRPSLKTLLLSQGPTIQNLVPKRPRRQRRPPVVFE